MSNKSNTIEDNSAVVEVAIEKGGYIELYKKNKWKKYYFLLSGGALYYKSKEKDVEVNGMILLKNSCLEKPKIEGKRKFSFGIKVDDNTHLLSFEEEDVMKEWRRLIKNNINKEPGEVSMEIKKKQSKLMAFKKNVAASAATSKAGKTYIKNLAGEEGLSVIKQIKKLITIQDGKKRAKEFEDNILRLGVKVILLYKNKDISYRELTSKSQVIKSLWSDILDMLELPFCYDKERLKKTITDLENDFVKMLNLYISKKSIELLKRNLQYIRSDEILDRLYSSNDTSDLRTSLGNSLRTLWDRVYGNK